MDDVFSPKRSLGVQASAIALGTVAAQVLVATWYVVAARGSSVAEYGHIVSVIAFGSASVGLLDFGTNSFWIREASAGRLSLAEFHRRAMWKLAGVQILAVIWALAIALTAPSSMLWISGLVAFSQMLSQTIQANMRAQGRAEWAGIAVLTDRVVGTVLFMTMWIVGTDVLACLVVALTIGPSVGALMSNRLVLRSKRLRFGLYPLCNPWRGSRYFGIASMAVAAQGYDVVLTGWAGGAAAAGVYGAVSRWTQPLMILSVAYTSASAPYLAAAHSNRSALGRLRSGIWLPALAVLVCAVLIVLAPRIVPLLLGSRFAASTVVLQLLAFGTIVSIVCQPMYALLMARGLDRIGGILLVLMVGTTLASIVVLVPAMGAEGAGSAFLAGQVVLLFGVVCAVLKMFLSGRSA